MKCTYTVRFFIPTTFTMEIGNNGPKAKQMPDLQAAIHNGVHEKDLLSLSSEGVSMSVETMDFMIAMGEIHAQLERIANVLEIMERRQ